MLIATNDYIRGILIALLKNASAVKMIDVVEEEHAFWQAPEVRVTVHFMKGAKELERMARKLCQRG